VTTELEQSLRQLLAHDFPLARVSTDDGSYGIALVLDGWYASLRNDYGLDAETVLPFWQETLDRLREQLAETPAPC
jgi:hypothetical protein